MCCDHPFMWVVLAILGFIWLMRMYTRSGIGRVRSTRRLDGLTAIVTGANSGIGLETARGLAKRGARVLLGCRNEGRGQTAEADIRLTTGNNNVHYRHLDLSSLTSIRTFCSQVLKEESRLDILVNNAAVAGLNRKLTEDGMERMVQTNHFGPFLLTNLLLGLMKKTGHARVVVVSSLAHAWAKPLDFSNLQGEINHDKSRNYNMCKFMNSLFAVDLARRLEGTGVTSNHLHPGVIATNIIRHVGFFKPIAHFISSSFFKTCEEGAETSLFLCIDESVEGVNGKYYKDCQESSASPLTLDAGVAKKLWEHSELLVKLEPHERHL